MNRAVKRRKTLSPGAAVAVLAVLAVVLLVLLLVLRNGAAGGQEGIDRAQALCVVCVDPGHGGDDQGASWEGRLEKEDNLDMALALRAALEERNIYVVMTRDGDDTLTLAERVEQAETEQADLYISLHRNYAEQSACGVEVWVSEQCSATSEELARRVDSALVGVGVQRDRGVRYGSESGQGDYYVLSHTTMPAILVELGFLQDEEDNRLLDTHMQDYAGAIADAVEELWQEGNGDQ